MTGQRGFTLIEMLISMSIFAVITSFVVANYRVGQQGDELRISAQLVGSMVRRAQTAAIAGGEVSFCVGGGTAEGDVCTPGGAGACGGGSCVRDIPRGYGVHFSSVAGQERSMIYFADTDGNKRYGQGEAVRTDSVSSGTYVEVAAVAPEDNGSLDIVFVPPKPNTFYNDAVTDTEAIITLHHRSTGAQKEVRINRISGQVSVD